MNSTSNTEEGRRHGSNVIWWDDGTGGKRRRVGKLLGLQGYSSTVTSTTVTADGKLVPTERQVINKNFLYNAVASFLASKHFNERRGDLLPHLPDLLEGCDFYWSYEYRDGQWSRLEATKQLLESINVHTHQGDSTVAPNPLTPPRTPAPYTSTPQRTTAPRPEEQDEQAFTPDAMTRPPSGTRRLQDDNHTTYQDFQSALQDAVKPLEPVFIYGAYWSRVSETLALLSAGLGIPYATGGSTSAALLDYPLFARTVPSNDGDARAAMVYYRQMGIDNLACLFINDSWGINYHASLTKYASEFGITVLSFAYDPDTLQRTIASLTASKYRYVFAIMRDWKKVARLALQYNIMGNPEYVWIAAEEQKWTGDDFQLQVGRESDLAKALHGVGTINLYYEPLPAFEAAMNEMAHSKALQEEFISIQAAHPEIFDNYTFPKYDPTGFAHPIFDAVLALGITACNSSNNLPPLFTGEEFYQALLQTEFQGVSGHVQLDPKTGSRVRSGVQYSLEYVIGSDTRSDADYHRFESNLVAVIQNDNITNHHPFIYNDNTTLAPPALPVFEEELNLIPTWALIFGYALAGLVMVVATICCTWCYLRRNIFVLRASQPFFLCQLCMGCFLTATVVFPWSIPGTSTVGALGDKTESTRGLNVACMSCLWLGFVGFAICLSSLASKIMRINQLLTFGSSFRHASVGIHDVMMPFYLGLAVNITMLFCITFVAPLQYQRVPVDNYDEFGRGLESFGTCRPVNDKFYWFFGTLLFFNFIGVIIVTRESYKARHLPPDFSDRDSLARAMMSLLETLMLGAPLLLVVGDNPTAFFLVGTSLISICCLTILLLVFIPKYKGRKRRHRTQSVIGQIHSCVSRQSGHSDGGLSRVGSSGSGFSGLTPNDDMDTSSFHVRGMSQVRRKDSKSSNSLMRGGSSKQYSYKGSSRTVMDAASNHSRRKAIATTESHMSGSHNPSRNRPSSRLSGSSRMNQNPNLDESNGVSSRHSHNVGSGHFQDRSQDLVPQPPPSRYSHGVGSGHFKDGRI